MLYAPARPRRGAHRAFGQVREMSAEDAEGLDSAGLEEGGLQDNIAHWVEVLDRWVRRIESGMGRQDGEAASLDGERASGSTGPSLEDLSAEPGAGANG